MYGIVILFIYAFAMIGATMLFTKREKTAESFYVGSRNMGVASSAMSIAATWIWAPALFVSAEKAYTDGFVGLFWFLVPNVLCLLLFIPFAKMIRKKMPRGITLSGYMKDHYKSEKVKKVYLLQLGALTVLSTAVQLLAGGKILSSITELPFAVMAIVLAVIAFSYSQFSGIKASVITDAIQMIFILLACVIFVPWALSDGNGIMNMVKGLNGFSGEYTSLFTGKGVDVFFAFGLPTAIGLISGPFGDQCFWQRTFSIKQDKIGKSFALGALLFGIVPLSMGILGFIAAGSGFIPVDKSLVNLELITHMFPSWVVLPFLFMLISGLLSTVDSSLSAVSSLTSDFDITKNLDDNGKIRFSKLVMVMLLIAGNLIANIPGITVTHLFLFYGTLRATTLLPTVCTLLDKKLSSKGICIGVVCGALVGLPILALGNSLGSPMLRTIGSLMALILPGIIAYGYTRLGVQNE